MERGYREQEREGPRQRQRSPDRRDSGRKERNNEVEKKFGKGRDVEDKFGKKDDAPDKNGGDKPPDKPRKEKKAAPAPTGEPMIVVNVNDRLGTKASIPCMASDPISMSHSTTYLEFD